MTSINYHQISNMMSEQLNVTLGKMQKKTCFLDFQEAYFIVLKLANVCNILKIFFDDP